MVRQVVRFGLQVFNLSVLFRDLLQVLLLDLVGFESMQLAHLLQLLLLQLHLTVKLLTLRLKVIFECRRACGQLFFLLEVCVRGRLLLRQLSLESLCVGN